MCLTSVRKVPYVSDRDIVCYKAVKRASEDSIYLTPFMEEPVELGKVLVAGDGDEVQVNKDGNTYSLGSGFIHCYLKIPVSGVFLANVKDYKTMYVKCIIPAGTKFYLGIDNISIINNNENIKDLDYTICAKKVILGDKVLSLTDMLKEQSRRHIIMCSSICGIDIDENDYIKE